MKYSYHFTNISLPCGYSYEIHEDAMQYIAGILYLYLIAFSLFSYIYTML